MAKDRTTMCVKAYGARPESKADVAYQGIYLGVGWPQEVTGLTQGGWRTGSIGDYRCYIQQRHQAIESVILSRSR